MEIRVLGAHNVESATTRLTSLLVDDVLAVDAGGLTSSLSLDEQQRVSSILVTHYHYDHIRDVAAIALGMSYYRKTIKVYASPSTLDAISKYILNDIIYPRFTDIPTPDHPPLRFCPLEPYKAEEVDGYEVLAVPVHHAAPTVGYLISSRDGKSFFYTGDTGPGLGHCWERMSPQLLIVDVTLPNRLEKHGVSTGHLTPRLLAQELAEFKKSRGYLPQVVLVHFAPLFEEEIRREVEQVSRDLRASITLSQEGMRVSL